MMEVKSILLPILVAGAACAAVGVFLLCMYEQAHAKSAKWLAAVISVAMVIWILFCMFAPLRWVFGA